MIIAASARSAGNFHEPMNPRTREGIPSGAAFEPVVIFLVEANDGTRHHCVPFGPAKFSTANVLARSQIAAFDWPDGPAWPGRGLGNAYASARPRNTCFEPVAWWHAIDAHIKSAARAGRL